MPQAVYILFGAAFTVAVSMALGNLLLSVNSLRFYRGERAALMFVVGAAPLSLLSFAICALGIARKGVFLAAGLAVLAVSLRRRRSGLWGADPLPPLPRSWKRLFAVVFIIFFVLYFSNAMAPEISPDGSSYHLGLVARYLREHGFRRITTNIYANLSQGVEMLFVFAFVFGRHAAAALVHFAFLATLPLAMLSYARRVGSPVAGVCGALFFFVSPVVGIDGISAYVDVAVAGIAFTLFYLLEIWDAERNNSLLVPIGLVAGFCYAAKYTAFMGVPYALGFIAWKTYRKDKLKRVLPVAICALLMILPWVAKNWLWLGNPFSPFLNSLFPNPYVTIAFEHDYSQFLRTYDLKSRWELPLEVTARGSLSGLTGPLFLLAPLGLLALRRQSGRRLWLAAVVFGIPYFANVGTRFLIPVLPFVSLAMALVFTAVRSRLAPALVILHALLSWPNVLALYCSPTAWRLVKVTHREALRIKPEEPFLYSNLPTYGIARVIERLVPKGETVFSLSPVAEAYTGRDILVSYHGAYNKVLGDILWTPLLPDSQPTWLLRFRFPSRTLRSVRVVQTASGAPDQWSVGELRLFQNGAELPRAAEWRLRAKPNPWDVQLAFDNSLVTRWRSGQELYPDMFLQVDFGRLMPIDSVLLESSHDQYKIRLKVEGLDAAGNWKTLAEAPEEGEATPAFGMRRAATRELKLRGINYILAYDFDFGADDLRTKTDLWGIVLVGEYTEARLYRIL